MEELKSIPGFPGYKVSSAGRVWSEPKHGSSTTGMWLKPMKTDRFGHLVVLLRLKGKKYPQYIHKLVLSAFVGSRPGGMEACHNNGDPGNNHVENLRWDTPKANQADRLRHGTSNRGTRQGMSKLKEDDVRLIRVGLKHGYTQEAIAEAFGVGAGTVGDIKLGKSWGWLKNLDGSEYKPKRTLRQNSQLDEDNVRLIRAWCALGYSQIAIGQAFGIKQVTVSSIKTGRNWGWVKNLDGSEYNG